MVKKYWFWDIEQHSKPKQKVNRCDYRHLYYKSNFVASNDSIEICNADSELNHCEDQKNEHKIMLQNILKNNKRILDLILHKKYSTKSALEVDRWQKISITHHVAQEPFVILHGGFKINNIFKQIIFPITVRDRSPMYRKFCWMESISTFD